MTQIRVEVKNRLGGLFCVAPELFTVSYLTVSCRILIHRKTLNLTLNKVKFGVFSLYFRASEEYN